MFYFIALLYLFSKHGEVRKTVHKICSNVVIILFFRGERCANFHLINGICARTDNFQFRSKHLTARIFNNLILFPYLLQPVLLELMGITVLPYVQMDFMDLSVFSFVIVGPVKSVILHTAVSELQLVSKVQMMPIIDQALEPFES